MWDGHWWTPRRVTGCELASLAQTGNEDMKIATRLALLQWAGNPADPAALWRLIIAWIMPGMRESQAGKDTDIGTPTEKSSAGIARTNIRLQRAARRAWERDYPDASPPEEPRQGLTTGATALSPAKVSKAMPSAHPTFRNGGWRTFLTGALCGISFITIVALGWWKMHPERSAEDAAIYDRCLMAQSGNTIACDAMLRVIDREKAALPEMERRESVAEAALKKDAAKLLAAGFSKREVVEWAMKRGFVGSQLSDAVGIFLEDLQAGRY
jgi:hypothetical protein